MATVTGTLKMFDAMTGPLKRITQSMNIMISTMHDMESATKSNIQVDKMMSAAKQQIALAEAEINSAIAKSTQEQNKFSKSTASSGFSLGKIVGNVFAINEGLELMQQLWGGITAAMERADEILGVHSRLSFVNDGLQTQYALQEKILKSANETRSSYRDTADTIAKLGLFAPNLFKSTDRLVNFTETLNKLFVASGAGTVDRQVALQQLGQALSSGVLQGDELRSISESAPLFMDQLAKGIGVARGQLKGMGADGELTSEVVVKAIEKQQKSIDKLFQTMPMTFGGAMTIMGNKLDEWIGKMYQAGGPLRYLADQLGNMITWMSSDRGVAFFAGMTAALNALIYTITFFGNVFGTVLNVIIDYFPEITGALIAWGSLYIPFVITKLWAMIPPVIAFAKNFIAVNLPILLIVAAVFLLIFALRQFGVTTNQIVGAVAGLFFALYASIYNGIGVVWNVFVSFAEFLNNIFLDPVYAVQKLFYDLFQDISGFIASMANTFIDSLNWVIQKINDLTDAGISSIQRLNAAAFEMEMPVPSRKVVDMSKYKMAYKDVGKSFDQGFNWGSSALDKLTRGPAVPLGPMVPGGGMDKLANINKVGEVGKIRDTVDISSEDLKTMRELAEMQSIQNFVSLSPVVQVTGDNHYSNGYDIDTVISRINKGLEEEIASSAKMVLNV